MILSCQLRSNIEQREYILCESNMVLPCDYVGRNDVVRYGRLEASQYQKQLDGTSDDISF